MAQIDNFDFQPFKELQIISIEIGPHCNLAKLHNKCPINLRNYKKNSRPITNDDIIKTIKDAYDNGFNGEIAFHYYNEPLLYISQIKEIIGLAPYAKYLLWTNGTLVKQNKDFLSLFNSIVVSCYTNKIYKDMLKLKKYNPNIKRLILFSSENELDDRKEIYESSTVNYCGCKRPFEIEIPIDYFGNIHLCCRDWNNTVEIGNIISNTLSEILGSRRYKSLKNSIHRPLLDANNCPSICKSCTLPDKMLDFNSKFIRYKSLNPTLTFVVVTRGQDIKRLKKLLSIMKDLSDEIVVILDSEDNDIFEQILPYADQVKVIPNKGSFEAYIEDIFIYCTKEWIFRLDDDETLDNSWTRSIINNYISDSSSNSYWIPRKWFINADEFINIKPWFPDYQLRLFRNLPSIIKMPTRVHEPMYVYGAKKRIDGYYIEHWDLCLNDKKTRQSKVRIYESLAPQNGTDKFYLFEDYPFDTEIELQEEDRSITNSDCDSEFIIEKAFISRETKGKEQYTAHLTIFNNSKIVLLPEDSQIEFNNIFISYHWLSDKHELFKWDNNRTFSPDYLFPGERLSMLVVVDMPEKAGNYHLLFDIVEEGIQWFSHTPNKLFSPVIDIKIL